LTTLAGRSTTSPAAIRLTTDCGSFSMLGIPGPSLAPAKKAS